MLHIQIIRLLSYKLYYILTHFDLNKKMRGNNPLVDKLSFLLGDYKVPDLSPSINLPEKGTELDLKSLGLTDRQIACIEYTITTSYNYKQIADKLITSESTVKKDMQDMYKFFGVKNREMLRILLLQYTII